MPAMAGMTLPEPSVFRSVEVIPEMAKFVVVAPPWPTLKIVVVAVSVEVATAKRIWVGSVSLYRPCTESLANGEVVPIPILPLSGSTRKSLVSTVRPPAKVEVAVTSLATKFRAVS